MVSLAYIDKNKNKKKIIIIKIKKKDLVTPQY